MMKVINFKCVSLRCWSVIGQQVHNRQVMSGCRNAPFCATELISSLVGRPRLPTYTLDLMALYAVFSDFYFL